MNPSELFEKAARRKFRFPTVRGEIAAETLFDLPLQSKSGCDLDSVAKAIHGELKESSEISFVETVSPQNEELADKLELVKYVIKVKQDALLAAKVAATRKQELEKLHDLLARKKDAATEALSAEEIEERIKALTTA